MLFLLVYKEMINLFEFNMVFNVINNKKIIIID